MHTAFLSARKILPVLMLFGFTLERCVCVTPLSCSFRFTVCASEPEQWTPARPSKRIGIVSLFNASLMILPFFSARPHIQTSHFIVCLLSIIHGQCFPAFFYWLLQMFFSFISFVSITIAIANVIFPFLFSTHTHTFNVSATFHLTC